MRASTAPAPLAKKDAACKTCGRAHAPSEACPEPREYHDAPFLKKYGA